jgi:hypothetical protein
MIGQTHCYDRANPNGGFGMAHNGRCFRGIPAPEVHAQATHHVRSGACCMNVCRDCALEIGKRKDKDTEITELPQ